MVNHEHNQRIGKTSMQKIALILDDQEISVFLKLEGENKYGSIKARTARSIMNGCRRHCTSKNASIVESSSGNFAIALAGICQTRGIPFVGVVDKKASSQAIERIRSYGAQVIYVTEPDDEGGYLKTRIQMVRQILRACCKTIYSLFKQIRAHPKVNNA